MKELLRSVICKSIEGETLSTATSFSPDVIAKFKKKFSDSSLFPYICRYTDINNGDESNKQKTYEQYNDRIEVLARIINLLKQNKIEYCLIKGFALSQLLYDDPFFRPGGDIDILVKKHEGDKVVKLLYTDEKVFQIYIEKNVRPYPILLDENAHEYREFFYSDIPNECFEIGTSLHNIRGEENHLSFFETKKDINISGIEVSSFDKLHTFLYLCTNIYNDDETKETVRARNYIDLGRLLFLYYKDLNWFEVKHLADKLKITHCLYYALSNLYSIYPRVYIKTIIESLDIQSYKCNLNPYFMTDNCGLCNWNEDILGRLLQTRVERMEERQKKLHTRNINPIYNYNLLSAPILISSASNSNYSYFYIKKYFFNFRYKFTINEDKLTLHIPFAKDIYSFFPRFTINVILESSAEIQGDSVYRIQFKLKLKEGKWTVIAYKNLFRIFKINPRRFEEDILENDHKIVVEEEIAKNENLLNVIVDLKNLGFPYKETYLLYKIWLQEDIVLEDDIHIHHNLLDYSDGEGFFQCKNEVSIDLSYPKAVYLP